MSTPTSLSDRQETVRTWIVNLIRELDLEPRSIGVTDFTGEAPLKEAALLARSCYGGVILGFSLYKSDLIVKKPHANEPAQLRNVSFPTPWNHLEAGLLFALRRPIVVFKEAGVEQSGIFGLGESGLFVHTLPSPDDFDVAYIRTKQVLNSWAVSVLDEYKRWG